MNQAIKAVEQDKKQLKRDDTITLHFQSNGNKSVGIQGQSLDITMWRGYVAPDNDGWLRKQIVDLFKDDVSELFDELAYAFWSDACPDCNKPLNELGDCKNKDCIAYVEYL